MEKCPSCGAELKPGAHFCTRCGFQLDHPDRQNDKQAAVPAPAESEISSNSSASAAAEENTSAQPTLVSSQVKPKSRTTGSSSSGDGRTTFPTGVDATPIPDNLVRSYFDGGLLSYLGYRILGIIVTVFTLGICLPWAFTMLYAWEAKHTVVNGHRLHFTGSAIGLWGHWWLWWFLTLITFGIYGFWVFIMLKKWRAKHTVFMF